MRNGWQSQQSFGREIPWVIKSHVIEVGDIKIISVFISSRRRFIVIDKNARLYGQQLFIIQLGNM